MDESRVRYSKLSMMTATNRLSIWRTSEEKRSEGKPKAEKQASETIQKLVRLWP